MTTMTSEHEKGLGPTQSIAGLLSILGHRPFNSTDAELRYMNVFRSGERNPSLTINTELDVWFDSQSKKGGNLLDFAKLYWSESDLETVQTKISEAYAKFVPVIKSIFGKRKRSAIKLPYYKIEGSRPIGSDQIMINYLSKIADLKNLPAALRQLYYYFIDENGRRKDFSAVGIMNENGGWEVRCLQFSGCIGKEGMTLISGEKNHIALFGQMEDYLTWYSNNSISYGYPSILILNDRRFLKAAILRIRKFSSAEAQLFDCRFAVGSGASIAAQIEEQLLSN